MDGNGYYIIDVIFFYPSKVLRYIDMSRCVYSLYNSFWWTVSVYENFSGWHWECDKIDVINEKDTLNLQRMFHPFSLED